MTKQAPLPASKVNAQNYPGMFNTLIDVVGSFTHAIRVLPLEEMRQFLEQEIAPLYRGQPMQPGGRLYPHVVVLDAVTDVALLLHECGESYRAAIERQQRAPGPST